MYGATAAAAESARDHLQSIATDLNTLRGYLDKLRTRSGDQRLRSSLKELRTQLKRKISEEQVKQSGIIDKNRDDVSEQQRRDLVLLKHYVTQLHTMLEEEQNCLSQNNDAPRGRLADDGGAQQELLPINRAIENEAIAAALEEIENDFKDLFEMQKHINQLVHVQGITTDYIESVVTQAGERVEKGQRALGEAKEYKGSSRSKIFCITTCVILAAAIPVIILAILVPTLATQLS